MRLALSWIDPALRCSQILNGLRDRAVAARHRARFGHQHVAVGQNVEPAWVIEAGGISGHVEAVGRYRLLGGRPRLRLREVDRRDEASVR